MLTTCLAPWLGKIKPAHSPAIRWSRNHHRRDDLPSPPFPQIPL